jgi:hypothetical protein
VKTTLIVSGLALLVLLPLTLSGVLPIVAVPRTGESGFAALDLVYTLGPPVSAVVFLALFATAAGSPPRSIRTAVRGLLRRVGDDEAAAAARTLARFARAAEVAGLAVSLLASVCAFALMSGALEDPGDPPAPVSLATFLYWSMFPAAGGLVLARLLLAPSADALAARSGDPARTFSPRNDLGLFALVAPVLVMLLSMFIHVG